MSEKGIKTIDKRFNYGLRRISDRLFYARIQAKLTQEDVANIRNITAKTVKRWETREGAPKNQNLIMELAEIYNISYPWLSFHFGDEKYGFEQGFEPEYINGLWYSLDREKQKATVIYLQKLMS
jgi:transcriptional regulator with XRE-family HTH domain